MYRMRSGWEAFKTFAILFSFIINLVLVITLVIVVMLLFQIKNGIAEPLIDGLHSSFVGLDKATIDRVIPVRETIPVQFTLPLEQNTNVVLTGEVPLRANATFNLPGGGGTINGTVSLSLPAGMQLPVALDLDVPVDTTLPVSLDVRAVIPMEETQMHDPLENLRRLLNPFVRALDNLPDNAEEGRAFVGQVLSGNAPDLLAPTDESEMPWPGYSTTAGTGYEWPADSPPQPGLVTGIVPGGMGEWYIPENAPTGMYIPYGVIGPAGIVPAGNELIDPQTAPFMGQHIYGAQITGARITAPASQPPAAQPGQPDATEAPADLGIITPVPAQ